MTPLDPCICRLYFLLLRTVVACFQGFECADTIEDVFQGIIGAFADPGTGTRIISEHCDSTRSLGRGEGLRGTCGDGQYTGFAIINVLAAKDDMTDPLTRLLHSSVSKWME